MGAVRLQTPTHESGVQMKDTERIVFHGGCGCGQMDPEEQKEINVHVLSSSNTVLPHIQEP